MVEHTAVRCPELAPQLQREWARTTARPADWPTRERDVTSGELMAHIDRLELAEQRKNGLGREAVRQYERCRDGAETTRGTS